MAENLPLEVDREASLPMRAQIAGQLRVMMGDGRLKAGERLPSTRGLATTLGISRTVVTEAYEQLYAEGWLEGRHGSGTYAADIAAIPAGPASIDVGEEPAPGPQIDLRPGVPWVGGLELPAWRRAWRQAAALDPVVHADPRGSVRLRGAVADHLRRGRGVACTAERVLITRGATNGLDLLAAAVLRPGDRVGVEEPGYPFARSVLAARGARIVPCPVDEHGLIVDALPAGLRLVYTTPSHQYPLGGVLPVPRRQALITWARRTGAIIAEDDYDGEFRYDVAPLPALYGLGPDVTVYLGTTTKILAPNVGVGWLVARAELATAIVHRRAELADHAAAVPQDAVRILLERGDLGRHIRRMRAEYARRRAVVMDILADLRPRGDTAGLHVVVELESDAVDDVLRRSRERGVLLAALDRYHAAEPRTYGLVLGYGAATAAGIRTGCSLVRALGPARRTDAIASAGCLAQVHP